MDWTQKAYIVFRARPITLWKSDKSSTTVGINTVNQRDVLTDYRRHTGGFSERGIFPQRYCFGDDTAQALPKRPA